MFRKIKHWLGENRAWRKAHKNSWSQSATAGTDGLTPFQHLASEELLAVMKTVSLQRQSQREVYLTVILPGTQASVFIYTDGAEVFLESKAIFVGERPDYVSPERLVQHFVAAARGAAP